MAGLMETIAVPRASALPSASLAPIAGSSLSGRRSSIRFSVFKGLKIQQTRSSSVSLFSIFKSVPSKGGIVCEAQDTAILDWMANTSKPETEMQSYQHSSEKSRGTFFYPRPVLPTSAQVPITALGAVLIDRAGRKPLLLVSATGLVIGCILTGTSFYLKGHEIAVKGGPILAVTGILVYIGSFSIGMGAVPWVVMSEIYPINIKGAAGSLATLVNWFGAWTFSYTFNFLMTWNSFGTFILYVAVNALSILFVIKIVPITK